MELIEEQFCFRFSKECNMAVDENGDATDMLATISIQVVEKMSEEAYQDAAEQFRTALATQVRTDIENVQIITVEEYNAEAFDAEGHQKANVIIGQAAIESSEDGPLGELNEILHLLPEEVKDDVTQRINDWLNSGGNSSDRYVLNQVEYAKRVANVMLERQLENHSLEKAVELADKGIRI